MKKSSCLAVEVAWEVGTATKPPIPKTTISTNTACSLQYIVMFVSSPSGFANTPVTKSLIYSSLIGAITVSLLEVTYYFDLQVVPHLLVWRTFKTHLPSFQLP